MPLYSQRGECVLMPIGNFVQLVSWVTIRNPTFFYPAPHKLTNDDIGGVVLLSVGVGR
ncbi:hypothetical protein [Moraxella equi]|uniref:hypothetical protein n=1 Tax=Moraxella equi TaxID=60442 RepID=UPI00142D205C|nr:hypothetical protein [Moraxella equi]